MKSFVTRWRLSRCLHKLKSSDWKTRAAAAEELAEFGTLAVGPLLKTLEDSKTNDSLRRDICDVMCSLATPEMNLMFVEMLQEWDLAPVARKVLEKLCWEPMTEHEHIYWALATRSAPEIMRRANPTQELLLSESASGDVRRIKNAVYGLIFIGREYTGFSPRRRVVDQLTQSMF